MGTDQHAAVFDLDGTLILSETRHRAIWATFFAGHGVPFDDELGRSVTGRRGGDTLAAVVHLFPGLDPSEIVAELLRISVRPDLPPIAPVPGAAGYVRGLADAGVPLALVTSASEPHIGDALGLLGLGGAFGVTVSAIDVANGKPDPEGYLLACARLGIEPGAAVGFEDSVPGVAAVRAAGLRCLALATTIDRAELEAGGAELVVADFQGLAWPPFAA